MINNMIPNKNKNIRIHILVLDNTQVFKKNFLSITIDKTLTDKIGKIRCKIIYKSLFFVIQYAIGTLFPCK